MRRMTTLAVLVRRLLRSISSQFVAVYFRSVPQPKIAKKSPNPQFWSFKVF